MPDDRASAETDTTQLTTAEPSTAPAATTESAPARRSRKAPLELTNAVTQGIANVAPVTPGYTRAVWQLDVTAKTKTPFAYPVGIELTMIPSLVKDGNKTVCNDDDLVARLADALRYACMIHKVKTHNDTRPHRDGYAVEAPSPVFEDWGAAKKWYDQMAGMMIDIGCVPHHPKITSGGGHLHVSKLSPTVIRNVFRDMQNRPYLPWIFNEADDDNSAGTFTSELQKLPKELREDAARATFDPSRFGSVNDDGQLALTFFSNLKPNLRWLPSDKGHMLAYRSEFKTLEFRMFEAPSNWEEQQAHIAFVQAYVQWVEAAYKNSPPCVTVVKYEDETAFTKEQCEREFRNLLDVLGLPQAPYERMIAENLTQRFERGTRGKKVARNDDDDEEEDEEFTIADDD